MHARARLSDRACVMGIVFIILTHRLVIRLAVTGRCHAFFDRVVSCDHAFYDRLSRDSHCSL
jgi:hypothetical protein